MKRKLLSVLLLLMVAMSAMADEILYLEFDPSDNTKATLKCDDNYSNNTYFRNGGWKNVTRAWDDAKEPIKTIIVDESCKYFYGERLNNLFNDFANLETITNLGNLNTSNVGEMMYMFRFCYALKSLDLTGWNTSQLSITWEMFDGCSALTSLDLSGWNTSNVKHMMGMFKDCNSLETLDLSGWNTSNVEEMSNMFEGCYNLKTLDLSSFNTSKVTDMRSMFRDCCFLETLDLSTFDTSNVEEMSNMFRGCQSLTSLNITGWNTSKVTNMSEMFSGCTDLSKSVTAKEGETGEYWATFYDVCGYQAPSGTQVFKVTLSGSGIVMTEITDGIVNSGEGVVLKSSSNNFTLTPTISASKTSYDDNDLQGTTTSKTNPNYGNIYVLNKKSAGIGFYKLKENGTIGANKAYLEVGGGSAREFFLFDETTGVNDARGEMDDVRGAYFDLQGRRVAHPSKGLYVVSGKKMVIK